MLENHFVQGQTGKPTSGGSAQGSRFPIILAAEALGDCNAQRTHSESQSANRVGWLPDSDRRRRDKDEAVWRQAGHDLTDQLLLLGLDIKMFYAGPKEAIMHAIYRQNFGFTDIVIGRKHADAPYDDGKDIWDGLAAQRKFDELKGELLIKPVKVGFAAFYEELGRVGLVDECAPKGYKQVSISGRELREKLRSGVLPDPRIMRPETAKILIESMRAR